MSRAVRKVSRISSGPDSDSHSRRSVRESSSHVRSADIESSRASPVRESAAGMKHIFVTQDFGPDRGGMARRYVELCRRFDNVEHTMTVSAVDLDGAEEFDRGEPYPIHRQPFHFREANRFINQVKWARWLTDFCRGDIDVIHCG